MDRMPKSLTVLPNFVDANLRRAARPIVYFQNEIDPQFRIATSDGDYRLAVTLSTTPTMPKQIKLRRVSTFIVRKQAVRFTLTSELMEPDCVYCSDIDHTQMRAGASPITRRPRAWIRHNSGAVEWIDRAQVDGELLALLSRSGRIDAKEISDAPKMVCCV